MAASLAAASASTRFVAGGEASPARSWAAAARVPCVAGRRRRPATGVRCGGARAPGGGVLPEEAEAEEGGRFVGWFREAWPYIRGHRGSTFVVVVSGEVVAGPHLDGILQDISLLHGLGIKFVLVPGTHVQIDKLLAERGKKAKYAGRYRITDSDSLEAAMEAAGRIRLTIEAKLSPGPPMLNLRRHGVNGRWHEIADNVASGNFLGAKRRGVVGGIDYGFTGEVKKIDVSRIRERLDRDSIVVVSNMGYSSAGEVLNCNTYEVATACALAIVADKLICIVDGQIFDEHGRVNRFMSIEEADMLIRTRAKQSEIAANYVKVVDEEDINHGGVQRVHIVDGTVGGSLLLELFTRDGVGTMIARGMYEGTRMAREEDLSGIRKIIHPLEESGVLVRRTDKELLEALTSFIVVERDGSIIACAALFPYLEDKSGEVAAIAVSEECRGQGQGDKLLDYVEKKALSLGLEKLFLLTTRTADWFVRRGFKECSIESLPAVRRKRIDLSRGAKYYMKRLQAAEIGHMAVNGFAMR
ncbi:putative amino-acid acetyltransferase NAGS1, chloroplastic isoform X1 [Panicum miliaceum]|uniref:amino-acid N-acetyltransferase n=1 Tax=Panicum miliaceum TaxID=4540 RepID=A0A3L6S879_PANMI|nr:putative amino-acid acetyltransferase NAGS1, chloroplastic isoform X1 [Panicum miliaceum]